MDLARVLDEVNPLLLRGADLSPAEREGCELLDTPAAALLGQVGIVLRRSLFNDPTTRWVDMWQTTHDIARLEWINGPDVPVVAARLAAKAYDGNISGVPGLRINECSWYSAQMVWHGQNEPVRLHMTRITDSVADPEPSGADLPTTVSNSRTPTHTDHLTRAGSE